MDRWIRLKVFMVLLGLISACGAREIRVMNEKSTPDFNHTLAMILVEYASAVYTADLTALFRWNCSRCNGLIKGFEMIQLIVDVQNCLQAYVGVSHDLNSIIIAFRGTQESSVKNWIEDLFWKQLDLNYPGIEDAMVHHGFYSAYHNTTMRQGIISAIESIRESYGNIRITVTGHSMGGALAAFCALDLSVNYGIKDVQLLTFGQPRIGNSLFCSYFKKHVPHAVRVTHQNDIVPHLPPYYYYFPRKTYHHFPREVWLKDIISDNNEILVERICDGSGEDPSCSRSVSGNSILDHLNYYGVDLRADMPGSCHLVLNNDDQQYLMDRDGNIVLSRDPSKYLPGAANLRLDASGDYPQQLLEDVQPF